MPNKPNPRDVTDSDLEEMYRTLWQSSQGNSFINVESDLLVTEMNRRLFEATDNSSKRARNASLLVSFLALSIAGLSAWFSYIDWEGDTGWQSTQIQELKKLKQSIVENRVSNARGLRELSEEISAFSKVAEALGTQTLSKPSNQSNKDQ